MKQLSEAEALHKSAAYCSLADRCIYDVKKKLTSWDIELTVQNRIIQRLVQERFLDEERFCRSFVHDKIKYNKWGVNKIKFELRKRNIPDEVMSAVLKDVNPEEKQELLLQLLTAKKKLVKGKNDFEIRQKLIRFAAGRGFTMDDILLSIGKLFPQSSEYDFD